MLNLLRLVKGGFMYHICRYLLKKFIQKGRLTIHIDGCPPLIIEGEDGFEDVHIKLQDRKTLLQIVFDPDLAIGESYMDGHLQIETGGLSEFLNLLMRNETCWQDHLLGKISNFLFGLGASMRTVNRPIRAKRNVAHHYDLDERLYDTFLDSWRQYSCGYFTDNTPTIEAAQRLKLARIGAKLCLKPDQKILDIGCGWGGLAYALQLFAPSAQITGITLSERQLAYTKLAASYPRADDGHLPEFRLLDYRSVDEGYDRIVSVGMLEHVGPQHYDSYFAKIAEILASDGVALIHTIGRFGPPVPTSRWLDKYIFPGGYLPDLTQLHKAIQRAGLLITDIEVMRLHYAKTLHHWRQRFDNHKEEMRTLYDERFVRMWDFYLAGSEAYFLQGAGMVLQIQLAHDQQAVPLTRDYIAEHSATYEQILCQNQNSGKPKP